MRAGQFVFRLYRSEDAEALASLYRAAVRETGPSAYSPEQVEAWAAYPEDIEVFRASLLEGLTIIAEAGGAPAAFGDLQRDGHVRLLYTHPDYARCGLASAILQRLEEQARAWRCAELTTTASRISRPVFERAGFRMQQAETGFRNGIEFERFNMAKRLSDSFRTPTAASNRGKPYPPIR